MEKVTLYIKESYNELINNVTWPTWESLMQSTILVLIASLIISLVIFLMNTVSKGILDFIYSLG